MCQERVFMDYVIFVLAVVFLLSPFILWRACKVHRVVGAAKNFASKPFVCPNCGHRFCTRKSIAVPAGRDKAYLKCPRCGKRDVCGRPYDLEENQDTNHQ